MPSANATEAVFARLAATAGLTAVVGTRITPQLPTQEPTFPLATFAVSSDGTRPVAIGGSGGPSGYVGAVAVYAMTEADAIAGAKAASNALHGWRDVADGVRGCWAGEPDGDWTDDGYRVYTVEFTLKFKPVG